MTCSVCFFFYDETRRGVPRYRWDELIEDDVVTPIPDQRILVHDPSGEGFDSIIQLAVFHRGWPAGRDADAGDD